MKKYFLYELKKSIIPFLIIAFAGIIMYAVPLAMENGKFSYYDLYYIGYLMFVLGAACAIMPIWMFSYKMEKRSTDLYYSLPMTKTKQLAVRYIVGFITIIAAYTAAYLLGFLITAIKYGNEPKLIYYLPLYFANIVPAYIIYSMASFAFTRANSVADGIIFIIFAALVVFMVVLLLSTFTKYGVEINREYYDDEGNTYTSTYTVTRNYLYYGKFFPFTMLDEITSVFQGLIYGHDLHTSTPFSDMSDPEAINLAVSFAIYPAISIGCTVGLFMTEHNCKAENCNQVSDSIFGYKTMLPLFLLTVCALFGKEWLFEPETLMLLFIVIAAAYALAALYKKSIKIGWKYAVVLLCAIVIGLICSVITDGIYWN